jgi:hypothetical protein
MVLYRGDAPPSAEALSAALQAAPGGLTVEGGPAGLRVLGPAGAQAPVEVALAAGPEVEQQSAQFAEAYGDLHPEREQIAHCNQRFELRWAEAPGGEGGGADPVDTACLVAERLRAVAGGASWLLDAEAGEFLLFV